MNGEKLKALREKANLTQAELADIMHVDRSTVAKWELGVASPRASMLPDLAKVFKCDINSLY